LKKLKLEELHRANLDEYKSKPKVAVTVVLDSIRSAMNVGSIFRTSDAFCVERIVICGYTATPPHKEITKTAIGATESVEWEYVESIEVALTTLKSQQYTLIGIEQTNASVPLHDFQVDKEARYALVLGNEVDGISDEALPLLDTAIEIPQYGTKHSLNVSVCGGIVIYYFCMPLLQA
jgi:23S rRNA (guanosine2251-2'-O)-methyltransferase